MAILFVEFSELDFPFFPRPQFVCVIDGMSRLMPQHHHDFLFRIGNVMFLGNLTQVIVGKKKWNFHRTGPVYTSPRLFPEIKMRKKTDMPLFKLVSKLD